MTGFVQFLIDDRAEALRLGGEHVLLVAVSMAIAVALGVPLGVCAAHRPRPGRVILGAANFVQTVPSLALLGFLIPVPFVGGVGARSAVVALVLYALLPIVRNTHVGVTGLDAAIREAAVGMGMNAREMLWRVELPLALPVILAGIRVATVVSVGVATIAAAIGSGGLGVYIFRGLSMVDDRLILAGAMPAAGLAILADLGLGAVERRIARATR